MYNDVRAAATTMPTFCRGLRHQSFEHSGVRLCRSSGGDDVVHYKTDTQKVVGILAVSVDLPDIQRRRPLSAGCEAGRSESMTCAMAWSIWASDSWEFAGAESAADDRIRLSDGGGLTSAKIPTKRR